jgi:DNA-binding MarR family transcriptional regulator
VLVKLAGELFHKFGRRLSERVVRQHYDLYQKNVNTGIKEHMREFAAAWKSFLAEAINSLSESERHIFDQLNTEPQHEAFLLIRSFSKFGEYDFPVALLSLADRLSITPAGASCVIAKLVELGAIEKTAAARINSKSARYRWIANIDQPF